jgi:chromosome partitioning protein
MITLVGSLKGGTGKSTVNFNLAVWLVSHGFNVKLYDFDPQKTLTDVIENREEEGFEPALQVEHDLAKLKRKKETQILVDVGTSDMTSMEEAIRKADRIVIPVPPSQADVWSTQRFIGMVKQLRGGENKMPEMFAFINRADTNPFIRETAETSEVLKQLPYIKFIYARLSQRTVFRRSFSEGLAVFEMEPNSKAAAEINALATLLFSSLFIHENK